MHHFCRIAHIQGQGSYGCLPYPYLKMSYILPFNSILMLLPHIMQYEYCKICWKKVRKIGVLPTLSEMCSCLFVHYVKRIGHYGSLVHSGDLFRLFTTILEVLLDGLTFMYYHCPIKTVLAGVKGSRHNPHHFFLMDH